MFGYCSKSRTNVKSVNMDTHALTTENTPLLFTETDKVEDGPMGVQQILDDALRFAVIGLKFKCAMELRRKGASRAELSNVEIESLKNAADNLFMSPTIPAKAKEFVLDPDVLTEIIAPSSLDIVARHLTFAVHTSLLFKITAMGSAFDTFMLYRPYARCARLGNVHTGALLNIVEINPPKNVLRSASPIFLRQFVEQKQLLVRELMDVGADVNAQEGKVFAIAASLAGHEIVLQELLRDPIVVDSNTPLFREALRQFLKSETHGDCEKVITLFSDALQQAAQ